jgi:hypothetical protein
VTEAALEVDANPAVERMWRVARCNKASGEGEGLVIIHIPSIAVCMGNVRAPKQRKQSQSALKNSALGIDLKVPRNLPRLPHAPEIVGEFHLSGRELYIT